MKKRYSILGVLVFLVCTGIAVRAQLEPGKTPPGGKKLKLVMLVVVDQFRYDYLTRFRGQYTGGLKRLLTNGADFVNANLDHYPSVTAVGHAAMLSGATPSVSGIVGNDWYDRDTGKAVTSVSDDTVQLLDSGGVGSSPRRMLVSTVGDEMKIAHPNTRVIGISLKDRSAILASGHMADAAYWYDTQKGSFVSSTYYFPKLPGWVKSFNDRRLVDKYAGVQWTFLSDPAATGKRMPAKAGPALSSAVFASPFGNELLEAFAEETISQEKLGQRDATDLLTVSFSSNDAVGHDVGPDAPEVRDISIRTDRTLGKLFDALEHAVGMDHVLVILSADHGIAPLPEKLEEEKMPGGRLPSGDLVKDMENALGQKFGPGKWILYTAGTEPYFNEELIESKKLSDEEVQNVAAKAIARAPHVARVFTRSDLENGRVSGDHFTTMVVRSFNIRRSGDLDVLLEPYWIRGGSGATHGSPYVYDTHIPLIFMGPGIKAATYPRNVVLNDLAPTLATMLHVETPGGSVGRVLPEILRPAD